MQDANGNGASISDIRGLLQMATSAIQPFDHQRGHSVVTSIHEPRQGDRGDAIVLRYRHITSQSSHLGICGRAVLLGSS